MHAEQFAMQARHVPNTAAAADDDDGLDAFTREGQELAGARAAEESLDMQDNSWRYFADSLVDGEEALARAEVQAEAKAMQLQSQLAVKSPAQLDFVNTHVRETAPGGAGGGDEDLGPTQAGKALAEASCLPEGTVHPTGSASACVDLESTDDECISFRPAALTERRTEELGSSHGDLRIVQPASPVPSLGHGSATVFTNASGSVDPDAGVTA